MIGQGDMIPINQSMSARKESKPSVEWKHHEICNKGRENGDCKLCMREKVCVCV